MTGGRVVQAVGTWVVTVWVPREGNCWEEAMLAVKGVDGIGVVA